MEMTMGLDKQRVYVREVKSGVWIVHDELDRKGGRFCDRATALQFVNDEFGKDATTVIHSRFATSNRTPRLHLTIAPQAITAD
jgi:hypothetical protein